MAADYLAASLRPLSFNGPAPYTHVAFTALCREQLNAKDAEGIVALLTEAPSSHPLVRTWRDLDTQMRNTSATERGRLLGCDAARWRRPAAGCSLFWTNRILAAFQEKDPARREDLIDRARWDAAAELTPPDQPLSAAALFTYAVRLSIVSRRAARDAVAGNEVLTRLTAASKTDLEGKQA